MAGRQRLARSDTGNEWRAVPCHGAGHAADPAGVAFAALRGCRRAGLRSPAARLTLIAAPAVLAALDGAAAEARAAIEAELGRTLGLRPDPTRPTERFEIVER